MMNRRATVTLLLLITIAAVVASCGSTAPFPGPGAGDRTPADSTAPEAPESNAIRDLLDANRSSLSDLHATQQSDLPPQLTQQREIRTETADPYAGFRIQIHSGRNVAMADSIAASFRVWSDTMLTGYRADTYTFFQQPYFKVHVGDFSDRRRAESYTRLVQRRFPDAWVVHDRIEPDRVPADTVTFGIRR